MKEELIKFFKSKLNIAMVISQVLAIIFLFLNSLWYLFVCFFLICEGLFFILFGVKSLRKNKLMDEQLELLNKISVEKIDTDKQNKKNKITKKSNVFSAIIYFMMGLTLIVMAIF